MHLSWDVEAKMTDIMELLGTEPLPGKTVRVLHIHLGIIKKQNAALIPFPIIK